MGECGVAVPVAGYPERRRGWYEFCWQTGQSVAWLLDSLRASRSVTDISASPAACPSQSFLDPELLVMWCWMGLNVTMAPFGPLWFPFAPTILNCLGLHSHEVRWTQEIAQDLG